METTPSKKFDLEERTFKFARNTRNLMTSIPQNTVSIEDKKQLIRSSGSVAANYIEANESLSSKDFINRIKICKKEAKESHLWLRLMSEGEIESTNNGLKYLIQESIELVKIFAAIIKKYK